MTTKIIKNQSDLESALNQDFKSLGDEDIILPFGKFKGESLEDVPNYYLTSLLEVLEEDNANITNTRLTNLIIEIEKEIKYREQFDIFISGE